jgi:hypothetical protein
MKKQYIALFCALVCVSSSHGMLIRSCGIKTAAERGGTRRYHQSLVQRCERYDGDRNHALHKIRFALEEHNELKKQELELKRHSLIIEAYKFADARPRLNEDLAPLKQLSRDFFSIVKHQSDIVKKELAKSEK